MGSTRPTDRSIGEATFLPQWMKGKSDNSCKFDYSDGAFSPPADDTFFLIHYPKPAPSANREGFRSISDFLAGKRDNSSSSSTTTTTTAEASGSNVTSANATFNAVGGSSSSSEPKLIFANKPRPKPLDDEFRTAGGSFYDSTKSTESNSSSSSRSIVTVASQIMFGKPSGSTNIATSSSSSSSSNAAATTSSTSTAMAAAADQQNKDSSLQHKASKSLPATPIASPSGTPDSSPRSRRRAYGNRFFTGAFVPTDNADRQKNGWLLGSILGQSRELITPKIDEEDELQQPNEQVPSRALSRKKSISSQNLTYFGKEDKQAINSSSTTTHVLQAQPSELREMNFWSPTSM